MASYVCKFSSNKYAVGHSYLFKANCGENLIEKCWMLLQKTDFFIKIEDLKQYHVFEGEDNFQEIKNFLFGVYYEMEVFDAENFEDLYEYLSPLNELYDDYTLKTIRREMVCSGCDIPETIDVTHTCWMSKIPEGEISLFENDIILNVEIPQ